MDEYNKANTVSDKTEFQQIRDTELPSDIGYNKFMSMTFGYMFLGLLVTAISSVFLISEVVKNPQLLVTITSAVFPLSLAMFALVIVLSFAINKISPVTALIMFFVYALGMGVTVAVYAILYGFTAMLTAFGVTALVFGAMALYGFVTKRDLSKIGTIASFSLFGVIIMGFLNIFIFRSSPLDTALSIFAIIIFMAFTAYDVKKLKMIYITRLTNATEGNVKRIAIIGALNLYLDFINIMLSLVRLIGGSND